MDPVLDRPAEISDELWERFLQRRERRKILELQVSQAKEQLDQLSTHLQRIAAGMSYYMSHRCLIS